MTTIKEWCKAFYDNAVEKGFYENKGAENLGERMFLILGELFEAYEEYRNGNSLEEIYTKDGKPEGFPVEVADALIRLGDLLYKYELVDVVLEAVALKHEYNKTRSHRHGGKLA